MMVTAYGDDERSRQASKYGADDFIIKPVDFEFSESGATLVVYATCAIAFPALDGKAAVRRLYDRGSKNQHR